MTRLAIVSDVHADVHAPVDALAQAERLGCEVIVCVGGSPPGCPARRADRFPRGRGARRAACGREAANGAPDQRLLLGQISRDPGKPAFDGGHGLLYRTCPTVAGCSCRVDMRPVEHLLVQIMRRFNVL